MKKETSVRKNLLRIVAVSSLLILFASLVPIHLARANWLTEGLGQIIDFTYTVIGKIVFIIGFLFAFIVGIVIAIEAWIVGVILNMNNGVFDAAVVQTGFQVSLSIANMGFVLGIIIIAIATILKRETYGIKQLLWKLVVAAILVNFSLVIMAPIFGFANNLTLYFLNCVNPGGGGCGGNGSALTSDADFAKAIAGAFNPQKSFLSLNTLNATSSTQVQPGPAVTGFFGTVGGDISKILVPIFSVLFIAATLVVMAIVLAVFAFMLLVRYVYIAILAVLAPFAWLMWVFPKTKHLWDQWWDTFIKWTMFAPIVVFFMYLAVATATQMSSGNTTGTQTFAVYTAANSNTLWATISQFFGNLLTPIIQNALNEFVLVGLMVGGMIAAEKMSIMGASAAVGAAKSVGNAAKGYVGKQTKKGARYTYQHARIPFTQVTGTRVSEALQRSRIPLVSAAGRKVAGLTEAGGKDLVAKAAKDLDVDGMSKEKLVRATEGARGNDNTLALIQRAQKEGWLGSLRRVGGEKDLSTWMQKNQQTFKDYDHGKLQGDVNDSLMSNEIMRKIAAAQGKAEGTARVADTQGILGTAGADVSARTLQETSNTLEKDIATAKGNAQASAQITDAHGILGTMNATVSAQELKKASEAFLEDIGKVNLNALDDRDIINFRGLHMSVAGLKQEKKDAQADIVMADLAMDGAARTGTMNFQGNNVAIADVERKVADAKTAANDAMRHAADTTTVDGMAGTAGDLMRREAEKFFAGKDRANFARAHPEDIFGGVPKFGLSEQAIGALSQAVAHGIAIKNPQLTPSVVSKLDNKEALDRFDNRYRAAINSAPISQADKDILLRRHEQTMIRRYYVDVGGGGGTSSTPAPAPGPSGTP